MMRIVRFIFYYIVIISFFFFFWKSISFTRLRPPYVIEKLDFNDARTPPPYWYDAMIRTRALFECTYYSKILYCTRHVLCVSKALSIVHYCKNDCDIISSRLLTSLVLYKTASFSYQVRNRKTVVLICVGASEIKKI